ncbi:MAG TPA: tRNA 2-thiouridine(34) synthase MnmA, partial [Kiritimatiellia bacterium]|nr:tRNA 2-thiouridine(34) synthase MnmA [Kiritimatiellia bacterium]
MSATQPSVAVGLSGGVDSSVAAWLLKRDGWRVTGLTMSIWDGSVPIPDLGISGCFGPGEARDLEAAKEIAARLGIEHRVIPLAEEYKQTVLEYFREEYLAGRTPNPCVRCNQRMKFGFLIDQARAQGADFDKFATGHYARTRFDEATGRWQLLRGKDAGKDQSYFLSRLKQAQLADLIFPLGELRKGEVKDLARKLGWGDLAEKDESQDFIECEDYSVLFRPGDARPGDFVARDGTVLGRHRGILHYTIGQRKGLELGGGGTPLYVVEIDAARNRVVVGPREELHSRDLAAGDLNGVGWAGAPAEPFRCEVQIRQRHKAAPATVRAVGDRLLAVFDEPQLSVTPGQIAVFYAG